MNTVSIPTKETLRVCFLWLSFILGVGIPGSFAWHIFSLQLLEQNIATWGLVLLLDIIGLLLVYKAGNEDPMMQIGWVIAAILIFVAIIYRGSFFAWGAVETASLICCISAISLWITKGAKLGMWPYVIALYVAFTPQGIDYLTRPEPATWWLWAGSIVGALFAIGGATHKNFAHTFVPWSVIPLNAIMLILVLR